MSDPASEIIQQMQNDTRKEIEAEFVPESESIMDEKWKAYRYYEKIKPEWKQEDSQALTQLKAAAERTYSDIFSESFGIIDNLYESIRVPRVNEYGITQLDKKGRIVWELDDFNQPREDWSSLNGQDIEKTLIKIQQLKFIIAPRVKELFLETVFAKMSMQDDWHESYEKPLQGTNPVREAVANRNTRDGKYLYFFRYYVWTMVESFEKELTNTQRLLERIRSWRINENREW